MKRILVALPLNEEQCDRLHRAAPGTEMQITPSHRKRTFCGRM